MKLGSLFDGIGGFPLAALRNGITPVWASEIEPFPIKVTQHHFPNMKHLGDITKINGAEIEPVDIITFGSPCQGLSLAGKREGLQDERSGLFTEAVRIIREMRAASSNNYPRFAVWENVPGAFSSNKGEDFRAVLSEIAEAEIPMPTSEKWAEAGMVRTERIDIAWRTLDAQYWGVPQRRKRIFLVADFTGQCAGEILFESEGLRGDTAESRETREGITASVERGIRATGFDTYNQVETGDVTVTLRAGSEHNYNLVFDCRGNGDGNSGAVTGDHFVMDNAERSIRTASGFCTEHSAASRGIGYQEECSPTLRAGVTPAIAIENHPADSRVKLDESGTVQTLTTRMGTGGGNVPMLAVPTYCIQGNCIDRADTAGCNGKGWTEDVCYTLNTIDRLAVMAIEPGALSRGQGERVWDKCPTLRAKMGDNQPCVVLNDQGGSQMDVSENVVGTLRAEMHGNIATYQKVTSPLMANSHPGSYTGQDAHSDMLVAPYQETVGFLCARDYKGIGNQYVSEDKCIIAPKYSVRRLTPLECERLQGFPDGWTDIPGQTEASKEELEFWRDVWLTWDKTRAENPEKVKPRTDKAILKWLKNPTSDSAQYKALGNSVAIPCVDFIMRGIKEVVGSTER